MAWIASPRAAAPTEADEIVRLATGMFVEMNGEPAGQEWQLNARQALRQRLGSDVIALVVDHPHEQDTLIAFAAGMIAHRLPSTHNLAGLVGYIQWVATDTAWRRHGLARAVTTALLDVFDQQGIQMNELHTSSEARELYTSLGFTPAPHPAMRRYPDSSDTTTSVSGR